MKSIEDLIKEFDKIQKNIFKDMEEAQKEVAENICNDTKELAPSNTGMYRDSIHTTKTNIKNKTLNTNIVTDLTVTAKSNGNIYNLGFLLETGTEMHAIPNAFGWGDIYGYNSDMYKRTLRKDWHPGFESMPHFIPSLNKNKDTYIKAIKDVLDKEFK